MEGGEEAAAAAAAVDSKDLQQQSKALDKLTDRVEDRQLDSTRVQSVSCLLFISLFCSSSFLFCSLPLFFAMAALASSKEADWNAMRMREKELAAVKINPIDVEIIANELELDKKIAERTLREHKGDAVAAVRYLLR
ncbi:hypothetical protein B296_00040804 [Ensete ventricosum]|uniref:Nascent polypeptide-associated complex subunit alpha-like UBA domain-containing protein n=1 Tax=Ensete ventricosum TaxID=4639 RepID=A0A426ZGW2_ENSVE|nr:hypothetical protein B296_00040804 [Ensete ventricosum]